MAEIRVTGQGRTTSAPDEATFTFGCQGRGSEANAALSQATDAAKSLVALLDDIGIPEDKRGVERARVHPRVLWRKDREVRDGWDANATVSCTISDPTAAFDLLEKATLLDHVSVQGPNWRIRPDNPAHEEARKLAVDDARMKAESYARAAGLTLGELMEIIESGSVQSAPMMRGLAAAGGAAAESLEPSEQSVYANITMVYHAL